MRKKRNTSRRRVNTNGVLYVALFISLLFAFLFGLTIASGNNERQQIKIQEQIATSPYRILSKQAGYVLWIVARVGVFVLSGYALYFLVAIFRNWLDLRARLVRPKDGLYPLVRSNNGQLYDPNRAVGENPYITLGALQVQNTAALPRAEKTTIRTTQKPPKLTSKDMPELPEIQELQLPKQVDFRQIHNGQSSVNNLLLGVKSENNQIVPVYESLYNLVHVGIGGTSGYGKSVFLQAIVYQLLTAREDVRLALCDMEAVTLLPFANSDRLLYPIAIEENEIAYVLREISENELNKRRELFSQHNNVFSLAQYNAVSQESLPPVAVLIDEATQLAENENARMALQNLALRGRKYGLFLIAASQDWKHNTFDTKFTNQFSSRFQFGCRNKTQARVLMGETGAETFNDPGRCMAQLKGHKTMIMQAPYIDSSVLSNIRHGEPENVIDLESFEPAQTQDDKTRQIRELKERGASDTRIAREVFGYGNSFYIEKVRGILQQQQQ